MKLLNSLFLGLFLSFVALNSVAGDDEFKPAYENEGNYKLEDPNKYFAYRDGRTYYTSGKPDGFRVNENDEESTDETIGILTLLIAPATLIYMNIVGWWE